MTDTPYFVIDDLTIGYHKVPVIRDISVKVQKGEIIALIGPNGAGKSTLLKTIARAPGTRSRGKIFLERTRICRRSPIRAEALQKARRDPHRAASRSELTTCRDVVATGRYPVHRTASACSAARTRRIVDRSDGDRPRASSLPNATSTPSATASASACCSRAPCAQQPEMILLDEPTSFLDVRHKLDLLTILHAHGAQKEHYGHACRSTRSISRRRWPTASSP